MKTSDHNNVGEIHTPESTIDLPHISVDSESISKFAAATNAEKNIIDHHTSRYDHANSSNKQLATGNIDRLKGGIKDLQRQAKRCLSKLDATDELLEVKDTIRNLSFEDVALSGFFFLSGIVIALAGLVAGLKYWFDQSSVPTWEDATAFHIATALSTLGVLLFTTVAIEFLISKAESDRARRRLYFGLGAIPVIAFFVWLYSYGQSIVSPSLQSPADLLDELSSLSDDSTSVVDSNLGLIMFSAQVIAELFASAICFVWGKGILTRRFSSRQNVNPKYTLLKDRYTAVTTELGKLREVQTLNEAYLNCVNDGRTHFIGKAMAIFSEYRAIQETADQVKEAQQVAESKLLEESHVAQEEINRQRQERQLALEKFNAASEEQERSHQKRMDEINVEKARIQAYSDQVLRKSLASNQLSSDLTSPTPQQDTSANHTTPIHDSRQAPLFPKLAKPHLAREGGFVKSSVLVTMLLGAILMFTALVNIAQAKTHVILTSNSLSLEDASKVLKSSLTLMMEDMNIDDKLVVYDATAGNIVSTIDMKGLKKDTAKNRITHNKKEISRIKSFLRKASKDSSPKGNLFLPQTIAEFGVSFPYPKEDVQILIVGSPLYNDPSTEWSQGFSMLEGYVPNDGHFRASNRHSPFSVEAKSLGQVNVHFISSFNQWVDTTHHKNRVHRFWDLWVTENGGTLATFTDDFDTGFKRYRSGAHREADFTLDETETKVLMERISPINVQRELEAWLGETAVVSEEPSEVSSGIIRVGIVWSCIKCDLDLHARGSDAYRMLYFGHRNTAEGRFNKDYTEDPRIKNGYEYIEFSREIVFNEAEIRVNFYSGRSPGGVRGRVRVWLDGDVYSQDFHIPAESGNGGNSNRSHWVDINLTDVLSA